MLENVTIIVLAVRKKTRLYAKYFAHIVIINKVK